jgi:hypothetical protein
LAFSLGSEPSGGPGISYDHVLSQNKLTIDSASLVLRILPGFVPEVGQRFDILDAADLLGTGFSNLGDQFTGTLRVDGYDLVVVRNSGSREILSVEVAAVPEPSLRGL